MLEMIKCYEETPLLGYYNTTCVVYIDWLSIVAKYPLLNSQHVIFKKLHCYNRTISN